MHEAYEILGADRRGRWLLTCDHATNRVPDWIAGGDLGLPEGEMARHIALDVGAAGVTAELATLMGASAILSRFSRLVIDPNRGEDDPTLIMQLYDGTVVPANRRLTKEDREKRLDRLYRPYHAAYAGLAATRPDRLIAAIHSFTPALRGRPPRPWEVGVLHAPQDGRLALPLIAGLRRAGIVTGDNEPYTGYLPGDSIDRHALAMGRPNVLIEVRNDLIGDRAGQALWAARLAPILEDARAQSGL